jgi:type I restriction enzyme R subunit
MIDDTIRAYREGRLSEAEYLARVSATLEQLQTGAIVDIPTSVANRPTARAFFSTLRELPVSYTAEPTATPDPEVLATIALELESLIARRKVRDWIRNLDIQNAMRNDIEDYLYDLRSQGITLSNTDIDRVLDAILELAKQRERMN